MAEAKQTGDLAWWDVDHDPLLEDWADTSVEATATALQALAARTPSAPVLDAAVRFLLANRLSGRYWVSTKQTAMALYGLTAFMKARGESPSAFAVDVAVNGSAVKTVTFDAASLTAPDPVLVSVAGREGDNTVTLTKRGGGALYWSAAARYFDTRTPIARTGGRRLAIAREYFTLSSRTVQNRIVYSETPFSGTAAPGDVVLVRLTVAGAERLALPPHRRSPAGRRGDHRRRQPVSAREAPDAAVGRTPGVPRRPRRVLSGSACPVGASSSGTC